MCSFVTQHNATDGSSLEGACNWLADCRNVRQSCCTRFECYFLYLKQASNIVLENFQPASQPQTTCIASGWLVCGWAVCWCQCCEQSAPWWRWAGISYGQRTQLHFIVGNLNAQRSRKEILRPIVMPFISKHHLMFQHDNAQPYVARIYTHFQESENGPVLQWPVYLPDMQPIEHVWDALDPRVWQRVPELANIQQLRTVIEEE